MSSKGKLITTQHSGVPQGTLGDEEVTLSLSLKEGQLLTSQELRVQLDTVISRVKNSKIKLKEKVGLLATLVKAHETLTKTERSASGADQKEGTVINAGVIVVPAKASGSSWHEDAIAEVEKAKQVSE